MKVDASVLKAVPLAQTARSETVRTLDRFPPLVVDICLEDASETLARYVQSTFVAGYPIYSETLTMPGRAIGPRPVTVLSLPARILYTALVDRLRDALPEPSRGPGRWDSHREFGLDRRAKYILVLDIAACYEYIDHQILADELLVRSMESSTVNGITDLLGEIYHRSRGLPQMMQASDILADSYLSRLQRHLERSGISMHRYADDMRLIAQDWEAANHQMEFAAEVCRSLGLVLSTEKSRIFRVETLAQSQAVQDEFFDTHFQRSRSELAQVFFVAGSPYEDDDQVTLEAGVLASALHASRAILSTWHGGTHGAGPDISIPQAMRNLLGPLVNFMAHDEERLADRLLADMAFYEPLKLEQICSYIVRRTQDHPDENSWATIRALTQMGRQGPWAKLWLLHIIQKMPPAPSDPTGFEVLNWAVAQLSDRHETVRAEAAWVLAKTIGLDDVQATGLYTYASPLSQPAIGAAVSIATRVSTSVRSSIVNDNPLCQEAAKWAQRQ